MTFTSAPAVFFPEYVMLLRCRPKCHLFKGCRKDKPFENTGNCNTPPDSVQSERRRDQKQGKRNSCCRKRDADDRRRKCPPKPGKCSGGRDFHTHEQL